MHIKCDAHGLRGSFEGGGRKDKEYSGRRREGGEYETREVQETVEAETESEASTRQQIARKWMEIPREIVATLERGFLRRRGGGIYSRTGYVYKKRARKCGWRGQYGMCLARGEVSTEQVGKRGELQWKYMERGSGNSAFSSLSANEWPKTESAQLSKVSRRPSLRPATGRKRGKRNLLSSPIYVEILSAAKPEKNKKAAGGDGIMW